MNPLTAPLGVSSEIRTVARRPSQASGAFWATNDPEQKRRVRASNSFVIDTPEGRRLTRECYDGLNAGEYGRCGRIRATGARPDGAARQRCEGVPERCSRRKGSLHRAYAEALRR